MYRKTVGAALVAAIAVLVLSACGSSSSKSASSSTPASTAASSSGGSTSTGSGAASGSSAKGAPIKLGTIATCSGPLASSLGGACPTMKAWASYVNANGGINGHPVQMTVLDDANSPTTALTEAKQLVQQDHVIAIVGMYSQEVGTWASYVDKAGVPVLGGFSDASTFATDPNFFASGGDIEASVYGLAATAKAQGKTKLGIVTCTEVAVCKQASGLFQVITPTVPGAQFVSNAAVSSTEPNYTSSCLAAKGKGVAAEWIDEAGAILQKIADQCAQQGFKPLILSTAGTYSPPLAKDANLNGAVSTASDIAVSADSTPATKAFHAAMAKYAPGVSNTSTQWNVTLTQVWSGGLLFQAAAKAAHIGPTSTAADVKKGLYALKNATLGGFAPPLTFTKGKPFGSSCYFLQDISGGALSNAGGTKPYCLSATAVASVAKALAPH